MSWFSIIKENRLVSENITHTKVNEQDPEQDKEDRCKKALIKFVELMDAYLDALGSRYFEWHFNVDKGIKIIESFPERRCCKILELMREAKNKTTPEVLLRNNLAMRLQPEDYIDNRGMFEDDFKFEKYELFFFNVMTKDGSAEGLQQTDFAIGVFNIKADALKMLDSVRGPLYFMYFEDFQNTWARVFDTIMGMIP